MGKFKKKSLDIDDVKKIVEKILKQKFKKSFTVNIYNSKYTSVISLINILSKILNIKPMYKRLEFLDKNKVIKNKKKQNKIIIYTSKNYLKIY